MGEMATGFKDKLLLRGTDHHRLIHNRSFVLLWSGQTVSWFGDAFFNLAVMWVVWTETQSTLQTAIIQAVWQLPDALFAPLAGVIADRWDRKSIMVVTSVVAAVVVVAVAVVIAVLGHLPPWVAFVAIFKLNSLTTFMSPARASIMPAVVGRDLLVTASGLHSSAMNAASSLGSVVAGILVAKAGAVWALVIDALSFLFVALCVVAARLPKRTTSPPSDGRPLAPGASLVRDLRSGWRAISERPVIRSLLWLGVLLNISSFTGPLWPALVQERLDGGAASYGVLLAAGLVGGVFGGVLAGPIERRIGAGRVVAWGWSMAGVATLGVAASTWLPVTLVLEVIGIFGLTVGGVASGAIMVIFVPDEVRGRVLGISRGMGVATIPVAAVAAGWLAGIIGVVPLFVIGGAYTLAVGVLAWANPHLRAAQI
jgi:MFS transporter, DHA3 family, macrolide efflux protein